VEIQTTNCQATAINDNDNCVSVTNISNSDLPSDIDVKTFFIHGTYIFTFFNVFYFANVFLFLKTFIENTI